MAASSFCREKSQQFGQYGPGDTISDATMVFMCHERIPECFFPLGGNSVKKKHVGECARVGRSSIPGN